MGRMAADFWVLCDCGESQLLVDNVPSTCRAPKNRTEAGEVARKIHGWEWTGKKNNGWVCPNCKWKGRES